MTRLSSVIEAASSRVTPSARDEARLQKIADRMLSRVKKAADGFEEVREVHLGGSFAKGTWLPNDVDLDIFVRISEDVGDARFEHVGLTVGGEAVKGYPHGKKYAQHPYTEAKVDGVKVNIVPCYDVKLGSWKSAADRSLYHVKFVNDNMEDEVKLQVRLLKQFMKVIGVYGAEIEREGFSGYASEVLVFTHDSFANVLKYFENLRLNREATFSLKDPVDADRELATAISKETVARMILASRAFLGSPDAAYFSRLKTRVRSALKPKVYSIRFDHPALSEDTLWGELKKSTRQLVKRVEREGFSVARSGAASNDEDRSAILLLPEIEELPPLEERVGPSVDLKEEVRRFVAKNREEVELVWVADDGRIHALQKREFVTLRGALEELCGKRIEEVGLSRDVALAIRRNGRILTGSQITAEGKKEGWFADGVDSLVSDSIGTNSA